MPCRLNRQAPRRDCSCLHYHEHQPNHNPLGRYSRYIRYKHERQIVTTYSLKFRIIPYCRSSWQINPNDMVPPASNRTEITYSSSNRENLLAVKVHSSPTGCRTPSASVNARVTRYLWPRTMRNRSEEAISDAVNFSLGSISALSMQTVPAFSTQLPTRTPFRSV